MTKEIENKIHFFSDSVRRKLGENVHRIVLFGSRAREDFSEGSDYDFLIVVGHKDPTVRKEITSVGVEFLNRYDELAASLLYDDNEWGKSRHLPIGINIERDGIAL